MHQEILFLRKSSVRLPFHVSRREISHFKHPRVSAVNRKAPGRLEKKEHQARVILSNKFNVYIDVDKREGARELEKNMKSL